MNRPQDPIVPGIEGRLALITGGLGGLGAEVAAALQNQGAKVIVTDLPKVPKHSQAGTDEFPYYTVDVADYVMVKLRVGEIVRDHGIPDLIVNAAGIAGDSTPAESLDPDEWSRVLAVNLSGSFWVAQECARRLIDAGRPGSILNFSSVAGVSVPSGHRRVHYATSKAGVIMLTKALASEWGPHGIRVNAICPGLHMTPMISGVLSDPQEASAFADQAREHTPLRRVANASDIRGIALFLLSTTSGNMTGQAVV